MATINTKYKVRIISIRPDRLGVAFTNDGTMLLIENVGVNDEGKEILVKTTKLLEETALAYKCTGSDMVIESEEVEYDDDEPQNPYDEDEED